MKSPGAYTTTARVICPEETTHLLFKGTVEADETGLAFLEVVCRTEHVWRGGGKLTLTIDGDVLDDFPLVVTDGHLAAGSVPLYHRHVVDVRPFRALRYSHDLDLAGAICPPFDTIAPDQQRALYSCSPYNAVRIELARETGRGRYKNAAATLKEWQAKGMLRRDSSPAHYLYQQRFPHDGRERTRTLLFGRLRLQPWEKGAVLPHEQTFGGPKEDRLKLLRATHLNTSPVFLIYRDTRQAVDTALGSLRLEPLVEFAGDDGQHHSLRRIDEPTTLEALDDAFAAETLYVADGHHRYETALAYRDQCRGESPNWTGEEPENFVMVALAAGNDPGLLILPIHRVTNGPRPWDEAREALTPLFSIAPLDSSPLDALDRLARAGPGAFVLVARDPAGLLLLTVHDAHAADALLPQDRSPAWRRLDYSIANFAILRHCLGLSDADMSDYSRVWFTEAADEAIRQVRNGRARYAVLLNPVPVERVLELADGGERMPQKSTFFYPKVPTGLLFYPLYD